MRLPLVGGAYAARSVIGNATRCINLYPEANRQDGPKTLTHYQRPGLRQLVQGALAPCRGLYCPSTNNGGYTVIGQNVYWISPEWELNFLGTLVEQGSTLVSMVDNGTTLVLVDGSTIGYEINLATNVMTQIVDGTGTFNGANKVDYIDTFVIWNLIGTQQFGSTLSNEIVFDALYTAAKTTYPDTLVTLYVNRHEFILFGLFKSEIWYDAGNANFPFAQLPGAYIEHGCLAKFSVASQDITVYWLGQNLQGTGLVMQQTGYDTRLISNYAISYAIQQMQKQGFDCSDAIGYCYTQQGHVFYVLTFPAADQTWVYDASVGDPLAAWHQRGWSDSNGALHRERANCHAWINNTNVAGDWEFGTLYALDPDHYSDDVYDSASESVIAGPIACLRTFPQILYGERIGQPGQLIEADGKNIKLNKIILDMDTGETQVEEPTGLGPQITLRISRNRGKSWQTIPATQSAGKMGEYDIEPQWAGMGLSRFPLIEVSYSFAGKAALNGAWIDTDIATK
jgi:hypothetical protein